MPLWKSYRRSRRVIAPSVFLVKRRDIVGKG
jgi:ribosomal protein L35AE/L33A